MRYRFGTLVLIAEQRVLFDGETRVSLAPKTFDMLLLLVENAGEVVSRETLRQVVWEGAHVDESVVSRNLSLVRTTLRPFFGDAEVVETISKRGYRLVVPVEVVDGTAEDAAGTPAPALEASTLAAEPVTELATELPESETVRTKRGTASFVRWGWVAAMVALIVLTAAGYKLFRTENILAQQDELAVVDFRDLSGAAETNWMGVALEESVAHSLSRDNGITALNGDLVAVAQEDLGLSHARQFHAAELDQLEKRLGVNYILTGTYMPLGDQVRMDLILHKGAKVISEFSETVERQQMQAAVERASAQMRQSLKLPQAQTGGELEYFGQDQLAAHFYAEGLRLSRTGDTARLAREAFGKAVQADPGFAEAHIALAAQLAKVGHNAEARAEAQLALDTCGTLPETRRLSVQAAAYRQVRNYPKALEAMTQLRKLHPEDQGYRLRMVYALLSAGKDKEALALLREMEADKTHPPNLEALGLLLDVLREGGDRKANFVYSDRILKLAEAEGSRSAEAKAHLSRGIGFTDVGDGAKAVAEFQQAGVLSSQIGDKSGMTSAMVDESAVRTQLHMPGAMETGQRALDMAAETGQDGTVASQCINLGSAALDASQNRSAIAYSKRALELGEVIQSKRMRLVATNNLVNALLMSEQLPEAEAQTALELKYAHENGTPGDVAGATTHLAEIDSYLGRYPQAEAKYKEALAIYKAQQSVPQTNDLLVEYAWMLLDHGEVARAKEMFATVDRGALQGNASLAQYLQARLAFVAGDLVAAEKMALAEVDKDPVPFMRVNGLDVLMQIAVRQKDAAKARAVAERYAALAQAIPEDGPARRGAVRAAAQAEKLAGTRQGDAVRKLPDVLEEATRLGHASEVAETKRVMAETT